MRGPVSKNANDELRLCHGFMGTDDARVALQTRAADRNPTGISSSSAGSSGHRGGPHMLTTLARIQLLNA